MFHFFFVKSDLVSRIFKSTTKIEENNILGSFYKIKYMKLYMATACEYMLIVQYMYLIVENLGAYSWRCIDFFFIKKFFHVIMIFNSIIHRIFYQIQRQFQIIFQNVIEIVW